MMAAFTAVVVVQWLWIKYAIRERETKFTSQVYDVLNGWSTGSMNSIT